MEKNWREEGKVSPVKNQSNVGACIIFGLTSVIESMSIINHNSQIDVSEADLYFCSGINVNAYALNQAAIPIRDALFYMQHRGIASEDMFPWNLSWNPQNVNCVIDPARDDHAYRVKGYKLLRTAEDIKNWIYNKGPVQASMLWNATFSGGDGLTPYVQEPTNVIPVGHSICVVGFSDEGRYWLIKNSWGTGYGDQGYYKVAYGEMGLCRMGGESKFGLVDNSFSKYAIGIEDVEQIPFTPRLTLPLQVASRAGQTIYLPVAAKEEMTLSKDADWITLPGSTVSVSSRLSITLSVNAGSSSRIGKIHLHNSAGDIVSTCLIKQAGTLT